MCCRIKNIPIASWQVCTMQSFAFRHNWIHQKVAKHKRIFDASSAFIGLKCKRHRLQHRRTERHIFIIFVIDSRQQTIAKFDCFFAIFGRCIAKTPRFLILSVKFFLRFYRIIVHHTRAIGMIAHAMNPHQGMKNRQLQPTRQQLARRQIHETTNVRSAMRKSRY